MKINKKIQLAIVIFSAVKTHWILHGRVFVMKSKYQYNYKDSQVMTRCALKEDHVR